MKQLGLALHSYHGVHERFPYGVYTTIYGMSGPPGLDWLYYLAGHSDGCRR